MKGESKTEPIYDPSHMRRSLAACGSNHTADAVRAYRLAIEAEPFGFEAFNIVAADTLLDIPTEEALAKYGPDIEIRSPLPGFTGGFAIEKASRILGWEPEHSWRDEGAVTS